MKAILFLLSIIGIGYFLAAPEKTMRVISAKTAAEEGYDNVYYCRHGFQVETLSREVRKNVAVAMDQTNTFLGRPGLLRERGASPDRTCIIRGGVDLPGAVLAWTDGDANISIDVPKTIEFCKREYPIRYDLCWSSIIQHEIFHTMGVEHIHSSESSIMSPVISSLRFTEADGKACAKSSVCSLIRHVAP